MRVSLLLLALVSTLRICAAEVAPLNERIAVSSTVAPDYVRELEGGKGPRAATYVVTEGKFLSGGTVDRSIEKVTFTQLMQKLAPDLARQKYYPTKDEPNADVLIVVNWGTTLVFDDPLKDKSIEAMNTALPAYQAEIAANGIADSSAMDFISDSLAWSENNVSSAQSRNATLLGYANSLKRLGERGGYQTEKEKTLYAELSEERYFVVLMAYDYQLMKKEKRSKLIWVTRLSVRAPGNNFTEALPVLSQAGGLAFGRPVDGLVHLKANMREGRVSLGELKFLAETEVLSSETKK
ncbi:hypothetical protein [Oleiharenicola lentus]|uniref:hypothetical protein n=1 Tax=Oleiharenicola lentus TaxID=2508720 RepID=UPI003F661120